MQSMTNKRAAERSDAADARMFMLAEAENVSNAWKDSSERLTLQHQTFRAVKSLAGLGLPKIQTESEFEGEQ